MKRKLLVAVFVLLVAAPSFAEKPKWAGGGKPTAEQKDAHRAVMEGKEGVKGEVERVEERVKTEKEERSMETKGLEKQAEKKSEQVQKELDKGSEKGKEARQSRKKWWKFWGE